MDDQRQALADALYRSFGGAWWISRNRALKHGTSLANAGFARPHFVTSEAEMTALADGAVVERIETGLRSEFFVKREGSWVNVDGGEPQTSAAVGRPGAWFALRRS